jgi:glycine/serine hydroxymethyltransferase
MGVAEMATIRALIARGLRHRDDPAELAAVRADVAALCARFPVYAG